jgi:hypothetical protein
MLVVKRLYEVESDWQVQNYTERDCNIMDIWICIVPLVDYCFEVTEQINVMVQ